MTGALQQAEDYLIEVIPNNGEVVDIHWRFRSIEDFLLPREKRKEVPELR